MKRLNEASVDHSDEETTVELSAEVKIAFGKQYLAWKARGWKRGDFLQFLSEAGFKIPARSINRWANAVSELGAVVPKNCVAGRPQILSDEQTHIVVGFILDKNSRKEEIHLNTVQMFIHDYFHLDVTIQTVFNYVTHQGFSSRVANESSGGIQLDTSELSHIALKWIKSSLIHCPTSLLCSVDFTFTSHRTDRRVTYAHKGGPQPMVQKSISNYTNCIVTCIWADGVTIVLLRYCIRTIRVFDWIDDPPKGGITN